MRRVSLRPALLVLALVGVLHGGEAAAYDSEVVRETLKGLPGVNVKVEKLDSGEKRAGFSESTFRTDVELKLRMAGIRVLSDEEQFQTPGMPWLYLSVSGLHDQPGELDAFTIQLQLFQVVLLERNGERTGAVTWGTSVVGRGRLPSIRNAVKDRVDEFINVWLSVNPRPAPAPAPSE